jgi:hypothetical protein
MLTRSAMSDLRLNLLPNSSATMHSSLIRLTVGTRLPDQLHPKLVAGTPLPERATGSSVLTNFL